MGNRQSRETALEVCTEGIRYPMKDGSIDPSKPIATAVNGQCYAAMTRGMKK